MVRIHKSKFKTPKKSSHLRDDEVSKANGFDTKLSLTVNSVLM